VAPDQSGRAPFDDLNFATREKRVCGASELWFEHEGHADHAKTVYFSSAR